MTEVVRHYGDIWKMMATSHKDRLIIAVVFTLAQNTDAHIFYETDSDTFSVGDSLGFRITLDNPTNIHGNDTIIVDDRWAIWVMYYAEGFDVIGVYKNGKSRIIEMVEDSENCSFVIHVEGL